jgi:hypothetical protein
LVVRVDSEAINFLEESRRSSGVELLTDFADKTIGKPVFWEESQRLRERMREALAYSSGFAGFNWIPPARRATVAALPVTHCVEVWSMSRVCTRFFEFFFVRILADECPAKSWSAA